MKWECTTLGNLTGGDSGIVQTGPFGSQLHQHEYTEEGVPVVMPKDISEGGISLDGIAYVPEEVANRLSRHKLKPNSIVLPRRGEVTKRAFVSEEQEGWICGTGCIKIEVPEDLAYPRFIYYLMGTTESVRWLINNAVGTTMLNLSAKIVNEFPVALPPLPIQTRIADILSAYDDLIENNKRRMQLQEEAARQLYREWFVRLRFPGHEHTPITNGLPEGWERKPLGEVCLPIKETVQPNEVEPETPYIGLEHIPRRSISLSEWGSAEDVTSTKYRFCEGDILFGKIRPYFHKVGVAFISGITSSDAIVVRAGHLRHQALLLCLMSSDEFVADTAQSMREGSKMPRADWKLMQQYPVLLPKSLLLEEFSQAIQNIVQQLKTLSLQNQKLRVARDLLLPKLMNGEIAV